VKLTDFGLSRTYSVPMYPEVPYLEAEKFNLAPELIFRNKIPSKKSDIWALGCIFAQLLNSEILFPEMNIYH